MPKSTSQGQSRAIGHILEEVTKEDVHSNTKNHSICWCNKPRYNTNGEKAVHQRLLKKLQQKKEKQKK